MSVETESMFTQQDHQVAYIFDPDEGQEAETPRKRERASKRRRVAIRADDEDEDDSSPLFVPLLNGAETPECVRLRWRLFQESWQSMDARIQRILRESNAATLDQVSAFVQRAGSECGDRIPSALIITGPNFASQELLFEQLAERLPACSGRFVRLRSTDAVNVKTALKKMIRDATSQEDDGEEDLQVGQGDGRRYLDYDLEALEVFTRSQGCEHVFVGFQDSEAFDSGLLSDLISLLSSWRRRIPFTLLFGIATSVELLQARLLKSACRVVYGAQFDCVQTETILESVFRAVVASCDVPLRLGPALLRGMLDRQHDQMAGIQGFISSVKYAYMCHFYANPLSILLDAQGVLGEPQLEAMRNLASVRSCVEEAVELGTPESLRHAQSLVESDEYLVARARESAGPNQRRWIEDRLRALLVVEASGAGHSSFSRAYVEAMTRALPEAGSLGVAECVRQTTADGLAAMLQRVVGVLRDGEPSLGLGGVKTDTDEDDDDDGRDARLLASLEAQLARLKGLICDAAEEGITLRSKYSSQGKVMRTTVIAQRVQLSRDSAALREQDRQLTEIVDAVAELLTGRIHAFRQPHELPFNEVWFYDAKSPLRDVMVPRPRAAFERSLARPHDYLSCACCRESGGIQASFPATCILYHLYREAGSLINVADMWSAFSALVRGEADDADADGGDDADVAGGDDLGDGGDGGDGRETEESGVKARERQVLVMFYRGLAELRWLGFVKASKKKADHVAKVRWL